MSQEQRIRHEVAMEIPSVSRFAAAFKHARLAKRWTQENLAKALHVKLRTVVSWETGTRLPAPGIVFLLCMLLAQDQRGAVDLLQHDLFISYLIDDLQRQMQVHQDQAFSKLVNQGMQQLLSVFSVASQQQPAWEQEELALSVERTQPKEQDRAELSAQPEQHQGTTLEHLFALLERLRKHPELIVVVNDFLEEVASA